MLLVRRGPIDIDELCKGTQIAPSNIWKYLKRLERGHYVVTRKEHVDGEENWVIYPKTGYLHDPHSIVTVGDDKW